MKSRIVHLLILMNLMASSLVAEEALSFNEDIPPRFSPDRCFRCHGPDAENQRSEFRPGHAGACYS